MKFINQILLIQVALLAFITTFLCANELSFSDKNASLAQFERPHFARKAQLIKLMDFDASISQQKITQVNVSDKIPVPDNRVSLLSTMNVPAELYLEVLPKGTDLHLIFYRQGVAHKVLTTPYSRHDKNKGGFSSFDNVSLSWDISKSRYGIIHITQTSPPEKGDSHFMPGAPLTFHYRFNDDKQQYERFKIYE